jgi:hypothetical protein
MRMYEDGWGCYMSVVKLDLTYIFHVAVELGSSVKDYQRSSPPPLSPPKTITPEREAWHEQLDCIREAAAHLKRILGATGRVDYSQLLDGSTSPSWANFGNQFQGVAHPRPVRYGLLRLAYAAIDLSGYAECHDPPPEWRDRGLKLLADGLSQIWSGLSEDEKKVVRPLFPELRLCTAWPPRGVRNPPPFAGKKVYEPPRGQCIDGFYTRNRKTWLDASQQAVRFEIMQRIALSPATKNKSITGGDRDCRICRVTVEGNEILLDGKGVTLNGTLESDKAVIAFVRYVLEGNGRIISGGDMDRMERGRGSASLEGTRWDRVFKHRVPEDLKQVIQAVNRRGYRLTSDAWHR